MAARTRAHQAHSETRNALDRVRKNLLLINTGGTLGMVRAHQGLVPRGDLWSVLAPSLKRRGARAQTALLPDLSYEEILPLQDSSDMRPSDWCRLAQTILDRRDQYDGFVVLHGTDTMAYAASTLSFLLRGLGKPVVLTGSSLPWGEPRSDAPRNLLGAISAAERDALRAEISLFFAGALLRGNRARKMGGAGGVRFVSPAYPALGTYRDGRLPISRHALRPSEYKPHRRVPDIGTVRVSLLHLYPGLPAQALRRWPLGDGLVLAAYGSGNGPTHDPAWLQALQARCGQGEAIVLISQAAGTSVPAGTGRYATSLLRHCPGLISGLDLTPEAALAKLAYLLALKLTPEAMRRRFAQSLCGECSSP